MEDATLHSLVSEATGWVEELKTRRAAFLGCGDSLAAARPAEGLGHRVMSAGDVAWSGQAPAGVDLSIALSWSGRTGATIRAAEAVRDCGQPVWAITSDSDSPLARLADVHLRLPSAFHEEGLPTWGFTLHSLAVLTGLGVEVDLDRVRQASHTLAASLSGSALPAAAPAGMTFAALPDSFPTAEFWSLKFIEATGVAARVVPLEETGHVDYFIGPQAHLTVLPIVEDGRDRVRQLGEALTRNGHTVVTVDYRALAEDLNTHEFALALSIAGTAFAQNAASLWNRVPFRRGQVDMSARHIQVDAGS